MLDIPNTIKSGQCFRYIEQNGAFTLFAGVGKEVKSITLKVDDREKIEKDPFWSRFFDLETDYEAIKKEFISVNPIMEKACAYAPGLRILNQDPWEALCSFVVSQNNNIKRIMGIVDRLCTAFGEKNKDGIYGFPLPEALYNASDEALRATGLGFRVPYIKNTAKAYLDGKINFDELKTCDIESGRRILMSVKGIGPKVADCALLFGCHRLDCFPMDTWMKKVMAKFFPGKEKDIFGQYAGVAQQYLFHWARTGEEFNDL